MSDVTPNTEARTEAIMAKTITVLTCPFCGGRPRYVNVTNGHDPLITCDECDQWGDVSCCQDLWDANPERKKVRIRIPEVG